MANMQSEIWGQFYKSSTNIPPQCSNIMYSFVFKHNKHIIRSFAHAQTAMLALHVQNI